MDKRTERADLGPAFKLGKAFWDSNRAEYVWYIDQRSDRGTALGFQTEDGDYQFYEFVGELTDDSLTPFDELSDEHSPPPGPQPQPKNPCDSGEHEFPDEPYTTPKDAFTAICQRCGLSIETSHLAIPGPHGLDTQIDIACVICDKTTDMNAIHTTTSDSYAVCEECDSPDLTFEKIESLIEP